MHRSFNLQDSWQFITFKNHYTASKLIRIDLADRVKDKPVPIVVFRRHRVAANGNPLKWKLRHESSSLTHTKTHLIFSKRSTYMFKPTLIGYAHCDLPCGIYDPAQAKIEAQSVKAAMEKYAASSDVDFKSRAVAVKEERSEMVKHHLWVLWTDYFKAPHFEKYPQLNTLFNEATKLAGLVASLNKVLSCGYFSK